MRTSPNRLSIRRRSMHRRNFLRLERLENRLALATVAANDFFHDLIDQPLDISGPGILANDTAESGQPLAAGLFSGPSHGTLDLTENGSFHYEPEAGFEGLDSFLYFASDGASDSMLAAVTINVSAVNNAPTAANDTYAVDEDGTLTVSAAGGLLANDADSDGDPIVPTITSQPLHGTVTMSPDGSFSYTPEANYNGLDGFSYLLSDGLTTSDVASATITVNPTNDLPVSVNDEYTTAEDAPLEIPAPGVLVNDTDIDGDALSSILVIPPVHGTVTLGGDGALLYTPDANFNGVDGFSYLANDGSGDSETSAVTVNITPVNDAPTSGADAYSTNEDTPLVIDAAAGVLANDSDAEGDALTATLVASPANGTLTLNSDGSFSYMPNANFSGTDSFTYTASDGSATGAETTVSLTVNPINDPPVAAADCYTTNEDTPLVIDAPGGILANDTDADGDALSAAVVAGPANGSLSLNSDGSFTYTPNANFNGADSFTYKASDGSATGGTSEEQTVNISVCPVNDAPTAADDAYSLDEGTTLTIDAASGVLANDSDIDGDSLAASVISGPANGSLTLNSDGSFSYTPSGNFSGTDSFVYAASDGSLQAQSTVTLTVNAVAHAPIAAIDNYSTGEDVPLVVGTDLGVLANDANPDGGPMTAEVVTAPAHGTLSLNSDGSFSFTPEANYHGNDSFTYKAVNNGQEMISSANIVIEPLNDAPVAANDEFTIDPTGGGQQTANNVIANDSDIDGDSLAANLVSGPAHGTLSLSADGTFNYVPQEGYSGDDTFRYQLFDGKANSNVATATLHVAQGPDQAPVPEPPANQRPNAANDVFTVQAGQTLNVPAASGLLANDSDPEGSPLTAGWFSGPLHGSVSIAPDGSLSYTPASGYVGMDALLYRASDGALWSPLAAVTIHVTPADSPDEAPLPEPAPTPTPNPEPQPCHHHHHCCHVSDQVMNALADHHHGHHANAVDAIFGSHRGWSR